MSQIGNLIETTLESISTDDLVTIYESSSPEKEIRRHVVRSELFDSFIEGLFSEEGGQAGEILTDQIRLTIEHCVMHLSEFYVEYVEELLKDRYEDEQRRSDPEKYFAAQI